MTQVPPKETHRASTAVNIFASSGTVLDAVRAWARDGAAPVARPAAALLDILHHFGIVAGWCCTDLCGQAEQNCERDDMHVERIAGVSQNSR